MFRILWHKVKILKEEFDREATNIIDASRFPILITKCTGGVIIYRAYENGKVVAKFSYLGFIMFLFPFYFFYSNLFTAAKLRQSIIRLLFESLLYNYSDRFELAISFLYYLFNVINTFIYFGGCTKPFQMIVDIDKAFDNMVVKVNYKSQIKDILVLYSVQFVCITLRSIALLVALRDEEQLPLERIFISVYTDVVALFVTLHFCYYLSLIKQRIELINEVLFDMTSLTALAENQLVKYEARPRITRIQEMVICEKIRACSYIYSLLYKASLGASDVFGPSICITFFLTLSSAILNVFFLMEAIARGLLYRTYDFVNFLIYVLWCYAYTLIIIFLYVHVSEKTVHSACKTSLLVQDIINSSLSDDIDKQADEFAVQLLEQVPKFTSHGLFTLDYSLLLLFGNTVLTFSLLLMQFATQIQFDELSYNTSSII